MTVLFQPCIFVLMS